MSTIIIFASKYGTVEKCANTLKDLLKDKVFICNVKEAQKSEDIKTYDTIIIGCSVHAGKFQPKIKIVCKQNLSILMKKELGLFLCTLSPPEKADHYFKENFMAELVQKAKANGLFGGELLFEKMNPIERFILKKISKTDKSESFIKQENIKHFAKQMNKA